MNYDKDYIETPGLEASEEVSRGVQKTPNRVTLDLIKSRVKDTQFSNPAICPHMTIAFVLLENGYVIVGKSAPADPDNFDMEAGRTFAFEDALRQVWALEAYVMRNEMTYEDRPNRPKASTSTGRKWRETVLGASHDRPP